MLSVNLPLMNIGSQNTNLTSSSSIIATQFKCCYSISWSISTLLLLQEWFNADRLCSASYNTSPLTDWLPHCFIDIIRCAALCLDNLFSKSSHVQPLQLAKQYQTVSIDLQSAAVFIDRLCSTIISQHHSISAALLRKKTKENSRFSAITMGAS